MRALSEVNPKQAAEILELESRVTIIDGRISTMRQEESNKKMNAEIEMIRNSAQPAELKVCSIVTLKGDALRGLYIIVDEQGSKFVCRKMRPDGLPQNDSDQVVLPPDQLVPVIKSTSMAVIKVGSAVLQKVANLRIEPNQTDRVRREIGIPQGHRRIMFKREYPGFSGAMPVDGAQSTVGTVSSMKAAAFLINPFGGYADIQQIRNPAKSRTAAYDAMNYCIDHLCRAISVSKVSYSSYVGYVVTATKHDSSYIFESGLTLPMAICRMALRLVDFDPDQIFNVELQNPALTKSFEEV
jgi:hypothetical protein